MKKLYAALDIGTQSAILLIGKVENGKWTPKLEKVHACRLGEGVHQTGAISEAAQERLKKTLLYFQNVLWRVGAELLAIGGTEVFRKAENGKEVMDKVSDFFSENSTSLVIGQIYSGKQEAEGSYQALKYCYPDKPLAILDIGGGSTEIAYHTGKELKKFSYALGAVKLFEKYGPLPEPDNKKACVRGLRTVQPLSVGEGKKTLEDLAPSGKRKKRSKKSSSESEESTSQLMALGGTATTLAMMHQGLEEYSPSAVEGLEVSRGDVTQWIHRLADLNRNNRLKVPGLEPSRVDLILPGLCILEEALAQLDVETFKVSGWGFRHYVLLQALREKDLLEVTEKKEEQHAAESDEVAEDVK